MEKTKNGLYARKSNPYIEMKCQRSDTYEVLSLKAADKTDISYQKGYCVLLFKVMGSLIKDEDITIKGVKKSWTLGRYLQLIKKSPNNLKIGVAIEPRDSDESPSDSDESCT